MLRRYFPLALVALIVFVGCAAMMKYGQEHGKAQKAYNQGNYDRAVYHCVASLHAKPDYDKAVLLLKEVAPLAYKNHQEAAAKYEEREDWDEAVAEYNAIIKLVQGVSSARGSYPTVDVEDQKEKACQNAAEAHYQQGLSLEDKDPHDAAIEFRVAQDFVSGYKDCQTRYQKAKKAATKRIAIMPFEDRTGRQAQFGDMGALLTSQTLNAAYKSNPEFLEFVTRDYLHQLVQEQRRGEFGVIDQSTAAQVGRLIGVHAFVFGKVVSVLPNDQPETTTEHSNTKEIYQGKKKPKLKVSARWVVHKKVRSVEISADFQIIDAKTGTIVKTELMTQRATDVAEWARYGGDERALTSDAHKLCSVQKTTVDSPEILANRALTSLGIALAREITEFYK